MGRKPRPDDLVLPNHRPAPRTAQTKREAFYADLDRLRIPRQRPYETRATFRNLCLAGGAVRDAVNRITHPKPSVAADYYDRDNVQWPLMCQAVLCIDEQAWAGTAFGPPLEGRVTPKAAVTSSGDPARDQYGTDQREAPAIRTRIAGARW